MLVDIVLGIRVIALVLFIANCVVYTLWEGPTAYLLVAHYDEESQQRRFAKMKKMTFLFGIISCGFLLMTGQFNVFDIFLTIFVICLVPAVGTVVKALISKTPILQTTLVKNKLGDFILLEVPLHYCFGFIWVKLVLLFIIGDVW